MDNATAIKIFIALLLVIAIIAGLFGQPLISLAALFLIIIAAVASFKILVKADAKKLAEKKVKFNQFPDTLLSEGTGGALMYFVIALALVAFFTALINAAINKPLLDKLEMTFALAAIVTLFRYYTFKQYKKIKGKIA